MPSTRSTLFRTWRYSDIASTPSTWPSRRMLSDSTPPASARSTAARSTRSRRKGVRGRARGSVLVATLSPFPSPSNLQRKSGAGSPVFLDRQEFTPYAYEVSLQRTHRVGGERAGPPSGLRRARHGSDDGGTSTESSRRTGAPGTGHLAGPQRQQNEGLHRRRLREARAVPGAARAGAGPRGGRRVPGGERGEARRLQGRITVVPGATDDRAVIARAVAGCDGVLVVLVRGGSTGIRRARPRRCSTTRLRGRAWCSPAGGTSPATAGTSTRGSSRRS